MQDNKRIEDACRNRQAEQLKKMLADIGVYDREELRKQLKERSIDLRVFCGGMKNENI